MTIFEVKNALKSELKLTKRLGPHLSNQDFTFHPFNDLGVQVIKKQANLDVDKYIMVYKGIQLTRKNKQLKDYGIQNQDFIQIYKKDQQKPVTNYDILLQNNKSESLKQILKVKEINDSIHLKKPELTENGTTGSYILKNQQNQGIGIFKPIDEEYNAPNNPKGNVGQIGETGAREGIFSGECAYREVAAYIIDQQTQGKFNVPITNIVNISHNSFKTDKEGSLQLFVNHQGNFADYPIQKANIDEIHRIGILDIRILNCDRNEENILFVEKIVDNNNYPVQFKQLIPIDHGLSFPSKLNINDYEIVWMDPTFDVPFSQENLQIIENINIENDQQKLKQQLKLSEESLKLTKISTLLLKTYAKTKSLYQIGKIIYREDEDKPSQLEQVINQADKLYKAQIQVNKQKNSKVYLQQKTCSFLTPEVRQDNLIGDEDQLLVLQLNQSNSYQSDDENESDQIQEDLINQQLYYKLIRTAMKLIIESKNF